MLDMKISTCNKLSKFYWSTSIQDWLCLVYAVLAIFHLVYYGDTKQDKQTDVSVYISGVIRWLFFKARSATNKNSCGCRVITNLVWTPHFVDSTVPKINNHLCDYKLHESLGPYVEWFVSYRLIDSWFHTLLTTVNHVHLISTKGSRRVCPAEDVYSSMISDPTFAFAGGPCCPTLEFLF
jgi:hypothetical protein